MKKKTGTYQWAPNRANCCDGCLNDCNYCYAKKNAIRFKRRTKENWKDMAYNPSCEKHIRKYKGLIMFPTSHDLHIEHVNWWFPFLKGLLEKGNDLLIVSKPQYAAIKYICDNLADYKNKIEFRFTVGSCNEQVLKFWEPGAPAFAERVVAMEYAKRMGFKTSASLEPLLDYNPDLLIDLIKPFITGDIWIGTMNHMSVSDFGPDEGLMYIRMKEINSIENIRRVYDQFKNNPRIKWKDSIERMLVLS